MLTDLDSFFKHIEENELTAVLLTVPQLVLPVALNKIIKSSNLKTIELDVNAIEILQVGKVPQIRIYFKGNEKFNLSGNEILNFPSIYKKLEQEVQYAKKSLPY